jgi:hypothetical protein
MNPPNFVGEVSPSYGDGVMGTNTDAHDPSVRFADTSPAELGRNMKLRRRRPSKVELPRPAGAG